MFMLIISGYIRHIKVLTEKLEVIIMIEEHSNDHPCRAAGVMPAIAAERQWIPTWLVYNVAT